MRNKAALTWLAVTAWWLLSGLVWTGQVVTMLSASGRGGDAGFALRSEMTSALLWIPITMALLHCVRRYPIERGRVWRALGVQSLAVLGVILFRAGTVVLLNGWVGWYARLPPWPELLWTSVLNNLLMSWMIVGIVHALIYAERERRRQQQAAELETRLARSRLDALSAQLNPHFLFNALNSIAELVHRDADAADRMLVGLGTLLRHSLDSARTQEVALSDELDLLSHYVAIEKVRLGPRLRYECVVAPDALHARVPHLLLQPLVENAIHHAVALRSTPGRVSVRARREGDRLVLEVRDDGGGSPSVPGNGIGLSNTRARLQCLYGPDHSFQLRLHSAGGTLARLDLPYRPMAMTAVAA